MHVPPERAAWSRVRSRGSRRRLCTPVHDAARVDGHGPPARGEGPFVPDRCDRVGRSGRPHRSAMLAPPARQTNRQRQNARVNVHILSDGRRFQSRVGRGLVHPGRAGPGQARVCDGRSVRALQDRVRVRRRARQRARHDRSLHELRPPVQGARAGRSRGRRRPVGGPDDRDGQRADLPLAARAAARHSGQAGRAGRLADTRAARPRTLGSIAELEPFFEGRTSSRPPPPGAAPARSAAAFRLRRPCPMRTRRADVPEAHGVLGRPRPPPPLPPPRRKIDTLRPPRTPGAPPAPLRLPPHRLRRAPAVVDTLPLVERAPRTRSAQAAMAPPAAPQDPVHHPASAVRRRLRLPRHFEASSPLPPPTNARARPAADGDDELPAMRAWQPSSVEESYADAAAPPRGRLGGRVRPAARGGRRRLGRRQAVPRRAHRRRRRRSSIRAPRGS